MELPPVHIFIGYDAREKSAYQVCKFSIEKRASIPVVIHPLKHKDLRDAGLFTREWWTHKDGQTYDVEDGRPFSTEFSFSRFLVPELWRRLKNDGQPLSRFVVFVDCDFLFLDDIAGLLPAGKPKHPVWCVQHNYVPLNNKKMDSVAQTRYNRKLWSSLMVFDMEAMGELLPVGAVNSLSGADLHQFKWLEDAGGEVGPLDPKWNMIPNHSDFSGEKGAVHFTEGGPWFEKYRDIEGADLWEGEFLSFLFNQMSFSSSGKLTVKIDELI